MFGPNVTQKSTISPADINIKQLTIFATLSTLRSFPPAIKLLQHPDLHLEKIITHKLPMAEIGRGTGRRPVGNVANLVQLRPLSHLSRSLQRGNFSYAWIWKRDG